MKQQMLGEIGGKLSALNLPIRYGNGTDISISTEFVDAVWSTGSKKISYESSVFLDEQQKTVFMYEKTKEISHGLSFGSDSGSSFQSGTTLFRKVKSIQYSLDGKAYEYSLDLGAIPKAIKETAKQYGWAFKTVIKKDKAMYPSGYVPDFSFPVVAAINQGTPISPTVSVPTPRTAPPAFQSVSKGSFCGNCGMPLTQGTGFCGQCGKPTGDQQPKSVTAQPQPPQPAGPSNTLYAKSKAPSSKKKGGLFGLLGLIVLALLSISLFAALKVSWVGWVAGILILIGSVFLLKKFAKGFFAVLFILILSAIILFFVLAFTMPDTDETKMQSKPTKNVPASSSSAFMKSMSSSFAESKSVHSKASAFVGQANTRGNTNGNIINTGKAAKQGNMIYIIANGGIYTMKEDGSELEKSDMKSFYGSHLNLIGNWMYYINDKGGISKTSTDFKETEILDGVSNVYNLIVTQDKMYFISGANPYSTDLNGDNFKKLSEGFCQSLNLTNNSLYYQDNASYAVAITQKTDGSGRSVIKGDLLHYSMFPISEGDYLYYGDNNSRNIYKTKIDGTERTKLCDDKTLYVNTDGQWVYYANEMDGGKLYKVNIETLQREKLCDKPAKSISIVGDYLVVTFEENNTSGTYLIRTDGSEYQIIE